MTFSMNLGKEWPTLTWTVLIVELLLVLLLILE